MRLLLDTCAFLWLLLDAGRLTDKVRQAFSDPDNEPFLSVVSSWEIALKYSAGRLVLPMPPSEFVPFWKRAHNIKDLPLVEEAALHVAQLPRLHGDPFDRMLVCQSIVHGMPILTPDRSIMQYPVRTIW